MRAALLTLLAACAAVAQHNNDPPALVLPPTTPLTSASFRGPFEEDARIAGFDVTGQATRLATSPDFIRLVPPIPLAHGSIFTSKQIKSKEWIVEVAFRVHGNIRNTNTGSGRGGRGLAFWYTKSGSPTKGSSKPSDTYQDPDSSVSFFGQSINFDGLGIVFDSAPSAPLLKRSDPAGWKFGADTSNVISAVIDDGKTGSKWYDDHKAGQQRPTGQEAKYLEQVTGECEAAFRNAPGLVWVRIAHFNKQIRVDLDLQPHTTLSQEKRHFSHHCLTVDDVQLPSGYHFGLSALASGNTEPDAVDVYAFDAWEVTGKTADARNSQKPVVPEGKGDAQPLAGTVQESLEETANMLQGVLASQARMTEAIDALARRMDAFISGSESRYSAQLKEMQSLVARSADSHASNQQQGGSAISTQLDRMDADIKGLNIKVDNLITRTNKNIGSISNRLGEIFTLANRITDELNQQRQKEAVVKGASKLMGQLWSFSIYVGIAGIVGIVGIALNMIRKSRLGSGGKGKKMI